MVRRFMQGIDPTYRNAVADYLRTLLVDQFPSRMVAAIPDKLTGAEKANFTDKVQDSCKQLFDDFEAARDDYETKKFVDPIIDIVADLPKDELAARAESLVNLTSFKRRITAEAETVGGPIDVAVISKGDGFIWIKRKHYFQKDLNPYYFANYYRG